MPSPRLQRPQWNNCPGYTWLRGDEQVDRLASIVNITTGLKFGKAEVLKDLGADQSIQRKEEWRKETTDALPSEVVNNLCSTSFEGHLWKNAERCKRWSLGCAALTGTCPCMVFNCKDKWGSTALAMSESESMNQQTDWQVQQTPHLVYSFAQQRCLEAWGTFWT